MAPPQKMELSKLSANLSQDAHKGFDIITKAIQAKTQKELMVVIGAHAMVVRADCKVDPQE